MIFQKPVLRTLPTAFHTLRRVEIAVHMNCIQGPRAFMKIINVLCDEKKIALSPVAPESL
jgi:hypothetical protein